jgi:CheY-like chemotaxis protein
MPREILIADPNITAQEEFEKVFEGTDSQLIFAENGEDALLKIKLYKPDVVIADVTMPNKDGFELCKIVKGNSELQRIPFVLLAGIFEEIEKSEQERAGADGVLKKPLKETEILPLLDDLLKTGPVPLKVEGVPEAGPEKEVVEEVLPDAEELPGIEGLEEVELYHKEEVPEIQLPDEEEAIIELTEVVDEETSASVSQDENALDPSSEETLERREDARRGPGILDEEPLEAIDLEEPIEELEFEEVELTDGGGAQENQASVQQAEIEMKETVDLEMGREVFLEHEEGDEPSAEAIEKELEEEIDRRIELVLDEEHRREDGEDDTILELESEEGEGIVVQAGEEGAEPHEEKVGAEETFEDASIRGEAPLEKGDTVLEFGGAETVEEDSDEKEMLAELNVVDTVGSEESKTADFQPSDPLEDNLEEPTVPPREPREEVSDDFDVFSVEELDSLGDSMEEIEELPVEEDLEGLFQEEAEEFEQPNEGTEKEPPEDTQIQEVLEEAPDDEGLHEQMKGADLSDIDTEQVTDVAEATPGEEAREEPQEEEGVLEEALDEGEDLLEEPFEESAMESGAAFSYPSELIREEEVSAAEIHAFQRRLSGDAKTHESEGAASTAASDKRIESLVRNGVEQVLANLSKSVIPELTKTIVRVASDRIEKVVQEVVPELAETAIRKEIERLQRES